MPLNANWDGRGLDLRNEIAFNNRIVELNRGEHAHLDLVGEFFNLIHHTNVSQINPSFGSGLLSMAGFGTTDALNARQIQFSLDIEY